VYQCGDELLYCRICVLIVFREKEEMKLNGEGISTRTAAYTFGKCHVRIWTHRIPLRGLRGLRGSLLIPPLQNRYLQTSSTS